jgi:hypothetical protein
MKFLSVGAELFYADRQKDMTKFYILLTVHRAMILGK